jgi:protein SCO1/2
LAPACKKKSANLPYYNSADFTPIFISSEEAKKEITHTINDFSFKNQDNKLVTQKEIENKVHIASFIFTTCGSICPTMTTNLKRIETDHGTNSNVVMLSYSVTPWIDSVPVLKKYQEKHEIKTRNWHFLTGSKDEIYKLARNSYFAEENIGLQKDSSDFLHTEHIILVDRDKRIRGIYNGTLKLEIIQLSKDVDALLKE